MDSVKPLNTSSSDANFILRDLIDKFLKQWKWFVFSLVISLSVAFLYLRYTIPKYKASISLLVKDDRKGGIENELSAFQDLEVLSNFKSNVDNEIEMLKSRSLVEATVIELGLYISYINEGRLKSEEIYRYRNIDVLFPSIDNDFFKKNFSFSVESVSDSTFILKTQEGRRSIYRYNQVISCCSTPFKIVKRNSIKGQGEEDSFRTIVQFRPLSQVVESYRNRITVSLLNKNTSAIEISTIDNVKDRAEDFLNTLFKIYNRNSLDDKNFVSENTSRFIKQRLSLMETALEGVEKESEVYKKQNSVTDIKSEADLFLENSSNFQKNLLDAEIQLKVVISVIDYIKSNPRFSLIPTNITGTDNTYADLINEYNQLILERNRLLVNAKPTNPIFSSIDSRIDALNGNILSSLSRSRASLEIKKRDLERQNAEVRGRISQIPTQEREVRVLARQQQIKEQLYLYLLQKGEEIAISLAVAAPNAKLIDAALASPSPVSPNSRGILMAALLIGLLIPFLTIYTVDLLDTKVKTRQDLERKFMVPFLGDVPKSDLRKESLTATSRSSLAEALRIIRTNLEFMLKSVPMGTAKSIFVTSTLPKEGKTFISVNLARTIALTGKRVLLIGLDLRNPQLERYMDLPEIGLTNYLASDDTNIQNYIVKQEGFKDFSVLPSGIIPPNPAELLMIDKTAALFENLKKQYDYIVVDTVPASIVTDTFLIAKYAHAFIYVVRANYIDKRDLYFLENCYKENKFPNLSLLLNFTDNAIKYGYGSDSEKKKKRKWFK